MLPLTAGSGWRRRGGRGRGGRGGEGWEEVEKGEEIDYHPPGVSPRLFLRKCRGAALMPPTSCRGLKLWECLLAPFCFASLAGTGPEVVICSKSFTSLNPISLLKTIKANIIFSPVRQWKFTFKTSACFFFLLLLLSSLVLLNLIFALCFFSSRLFIWNITLPWLPFISTIILACSKLWNLSLLN